MSTSSNSSSSSWSFVVGTTGLWLVLCSHLIVVCSSFTPIPSTSTTTTTTSARSYFSNQQQQQQPQFFIGDNSRLAAASSSSSSSSAAATTVTTDSFIDTELRSAAMKLHTRSQAPREGQAAEPKQKPHTTTIEDYLQFLVDSQHVYEALDEVVKTNSDVLSKFQNTGLERTNALETDIDYICTTYNLDRPPVGQPGSKYATVLRTLGNEQSIPEFMCHYYNFVFAHWAGGLMIGKKMSSLLLDNKTLEFYKFNGDNLNDTKRKVKDDIEDMVTRWSREEKDRCVNETAAAFMGGGSINSHLSGGQSPH